MVETQDHTAYRNARRQMQWLKAPYIIDICLYYLYLSE